MVRVVYAENIASLAEAALRFLEAGQPDVQNPITSDATVGSGVSGSKARDVDYLALQTGDVLSAENSGESAYGRELCDLQDKIGEEVKKMLVEDPSSEVKRALLSQIPRLCVFFGREATHDVLLSHMTIFPNDSDWKLRRALYGAVLGLGIYVGGLTMQQYLLPLLQEGVNDTEEAVAEKALNVLASHVSLGLVSKKFIRDLARGIVPLLFHPSTWLRFGAVAFVMASAKVLSTVEVQVMLLPLVSGCLKYPLLEIYSEPVFLEALRPPVPRDAFTYLLQVNNPTPLWKWLELRVKNRREGKMPLPLPPKPNTHTNPHTKTLHTNAPNSDTYTRAPTQTDASSEVLHNLSADAEVGLLKLKDYITTLRLKLQAAVGMVSRPDTPLGISGSTILQTTGRTSSRTHSRTPSCVSALAGANIGGVHSHDAMEHTPAYDRSNNTNTLGNWSESLENLHVSASERASGHDPSKAQMSIKLGSIPGLALRTANLKNRVTSALPAHRPHEHAHTRAHNHAHARGSEHVQTRGGGDHRDASRAMEDTTKVLDNAQTGFTTPTKSMGAESNRDLGDSEVSLDSKPPVLHDMQSDFLVPQSPTSTNTTKDGREDNRPGNEDSLLDAVNTVSHQGTHSAVLGGAVDAHVITDSLDQDFFTPGGGGGSMRDSKDGTGSVINSKGRKIEAVSKGSKENQAASSRTHTRTRTRTHSRTRKGDATHTHRGVSGVSDHKGKGKKEQALYNAPVSPLVHANEHSSHSIGRAQTHTNTHSAYTDTHEPIVGDLHTARASQRYSSEGRLSRSEGTRRFSSEKGSDSQSNLSDMSDSESDFGPDIPGDDPTLMDTEGEIVLEIDIHQHTRALANESGLGASVIDGDQTPGASADTAREKFGTGADSSDIYPISSNTNTHTYGLTRPTSHANAQAHIHAITRAHAHNDASKPAQGQDKRQANTQSHAESDKDRRSGSSRVAGSGGAADNRSVTGVKEGLRRVVECPIRLPVQPSADLARFIRKRQLRVFPSMVDHDGHLGLLAEQSARLNETEVDAVRAVRPNMSTLNTNRSSWKPRGTLIAHLFEHKGPVNCLAVAEDNMFFASASDDGTVKIWDAARLVKAFACKSSQTYRPPPPREGLMGVRHIRSLAMCESSRSIACVSVSPNSGASSIHVFKVGLESSTERTGQGNEAAYSRYAHPETVYSVDIDEFDEGAVSEVAHVYANGCSLLVYITVRGCVYAVDLRTNQTVWKIRLDPSVGLVTAFLIDQTRCWMVVGTSKGALVVCDIRFRVAVTTWLHPGGYPVTRIIRADYLPDTQLFVACGPWVTVWDIETRRCLRLLRVTESEGTVDVSNAPPEPIPDMKPVPFVSEYNSKSTTVHQVPQTPGIPGSYGSTKGEHSHSTHQPSYTDPHTHTSTHPGEYPSKQTTPSAYNNIPSTSSLGALFAGINMCDSPRTVRALVCPPETPYILTASMDSTIRLWNLSNPTLSFHISSPYINESERHAHPDSVPWSKGWGGTSTSRQDSGTANVNAGQGGSSTSLYSNTDSQSYARSDSSTRAHPNSRGAGSSDPQPHSSYSWQELAGLTIITEQTVQGSGAPAPTRGPYTPPANHRGGINDLAYVYLNPYRLIVSAGADSTVKVWV